MRNREVKKSRLKKRSTCRDRDNDRKEVHVQIETTTEKNKIKGFHGYL